MSVQILAAYVSAAAEAEAFAKAAIQAAAREKAARQTYAKRLAEVVAQPHAGAKEQHLDLEAARMFMAAHD
jgi:hypothetical protein